MLYARVEARVWITKAIPAIAGRTTLAVRDEVSGARQVALDLVGANRGDRVLVATGSPAATAAGVPVDAVILALVEGSDPMERSA